MPMYRHLYIIVFVRGIVKRQRKFLWGIVQTFVRAQDRALNSLSRVTMLCSLV